VASSATGTGVSVAVAVNRGALHKGQAPADWLMPAPQRWQRIVSPSG
jgi:hypothetical protein